MTAFFRPAFAAVCVTSLVNGLYSTPAFATGDIVVHSFTGGADGAYPVSSLINLNGVLYGTTAGNSASNGTAFSLTLKKVETVMHDFTGATTDGAAPTAGLLNVGGVFYGTTSGGGANNAGTVFSMPSAGGTPRVVYSFGASATDGISPASQLVEVGTTLYGTTTYGGTYGKGTIFSITPAGTYKVLHSFGAISGDGAEPTAGLVYVNSKLYGTTEYGGVTTGVGCFLGCGTVFTITTGGTYAQVHKFTGGNTDGRQPYSALAYINTTVYGTTLNAGASNWGTVFQVTKAGVESVLHSFSGATDGANPAGGLINDAGILYGTTSYYGPNGGGTVFSLTTAGIEGVVYSFGAKANDGTSPNATLLDVSGTFYGTTVSGGTAGLGTVFSVPK